LATGVLKSTAGVISSSLLNLASEVTGILPIANGGTNASVFSTLPLAFDGTRLVGSSTITLATIQATSTTAASRFPYASSTAFTATHFNFTNATGTNATTTIMNVDSRLTIGGSVGIATTSPYAKLSIELDTSNPAFVISNNGSTSPTLFVGGVNQNGFIGMGTTTNISSARLIMDNTIGQSGSGATNAIAGIHQMYTFNPNTTNTVQVGNRLVLLNAPVGQTATNTAVAQIIRAVDNTAISNLVRGLEIVANGGSNTFGVNTGVRSTGNTFGVQGITSGLAGGTSTPAALYGETTGTTGSNILRLYSSTMTASSAALIYQETSAFTGTGLEMDFGRGTGSFTGDFLNLQSGGNSRFRVSYGGTTTIGQLSQTQTQASLHIGFGGLCVDNDGSCTASTSGRISAVQYNTGNADLAEMYYSNEGIEPGDIVMTTGKYEIGRAGTSTDPILGVVTTKPGIVLGAGERKLMSIPEFAVGLVGRVPVKVSTENGPIQVGDKIVLSQLTGIGMRAGTNTPNGVTVVGTALEAWDGTTYLSEATIETETARVASGTPVCVTTTSEVSHNLAGGGDSEGKQGSYGNTATETDTDCVQEMTDVVPLAGIAQVSTLETTEVKIGKVMMFIDLGAYVYQSKTPGLTWEDMGDNIAIHKAIDMMGHDIFNVGRIASANGSWFIDQEGNVKAYTVRAKKVYAEENLEVGSGDMPTGVTIFDKATSDPYCLQVASGAISALPGKCDGTPVDASFGGGSGGSGGGADPAPSNTPDETPAPEATDVIVTPTEGDSAPVEGSDVSPETGGATEPSSGTGETLAP
jgi:hypothetical protein